MKKRSVAKAAPSQGTVLLYKGQMKWVYLFLLPTIVIFILFYVSPIFISLCTSFTKWNGFQTPQWLGLKNYTKLFKNSAFKIALRNLLNWSLIAATVHVGFGVLVAYILSKQPKGWKGIRAIMLIPNMISVSAWAMIFKFVFNNDIGILNKLIRVVSPDFQVKWFYESPAAFWAITMTWVFFAGVVMLVVYNDIMAIPSSITEAALIDGANSWQIAIRVHLPLCRTSIGTGVIMSVTARISMYEKIMLTTRGGPGDDTTRLCHFMFKKICSKCLKTLAFLGTL